jgi:hypothetical protein
MTYSVAITTFNRRFDLFKNIFTKVKQQREDIPVLVFINGLTNLPFDEEYRKNILEFLTPFKNTFPIVFPEFRSNSRFWNMACQMSTTDNVLILQDDIDMEDTFFDDFDVLHQPISDHCIYINGSFGGLYLNKYRVSELNWFDERYIGIGHEDGTFLIRYSRKYGPMPTLNVPSLNNRYDLEWQKDLLENEIRLDGQRLDNQFSRFSRFNEEIQLLINGDQPVYGVPSIQQYPYEKFYWDHKNEL